MVELSQYGHIHLGLLERVRVLELPNEDFRHSRGGLGMLDENLLETRRYLFSFLPGSLQPLILADETIWVCIYHDRDNQDTSSESISNFLIAPLALDKVFGHQSHKCIARVQGIFDGALPMRSWFNVSMSNEPTDGSFDEPNLQVGAEACILGSMTDKEPEVIEIPYVHIFFSPSNVCHDALRKPCAESARVTQSPSMALLGTLFFSPATDHVRERDIPPQLLPFLVNTNAL